MDILLIEALVRELAGQLAGAALSKAYQPGEDEILLRLWNGRANLRLLLSASPRFGRLQLTAREYPNPPRPPRFAALLRARLARLERIEQLPGERLVVFHWRGKMGEPYRLVLELFGPRGDLRLVDGEGRVIDSLRRLNGPAGREAADGFYRMPEKEGRLELAAGLPVLPGECREPEVFRRWLLQHLTPMSPLVAWDLAEGVRLGHPPEDVLGEFRRHWLEGAFLPVTGRWRDQSVFAPFAPLFLDLEERQVHASFSEAADHHYFSQALASGAVGGRDGLVKAVAARRRRLQRLLSKLQGEDSRKADPEEVRHRGELLLANLHRVRRGMTEIVVEDYGHDPPRPLTLSLDPTLSPQENAERLFKGYKKEKRGLPHRRRRLDETREELDWLEEVSLALDEAESPADLVPIRDELGAAGLLPRPAASPAPRPRPAGPTYRQARTPGGYRLCWGRNGRSNDFVSRSLAAPGDLWFHAQGLPGAHLVLKREGRKGEFPREDLLYAAAVAAGWSRGKDADRVEVMVADAGEVRKPKGARPGLVVVERFTTVRVSPCRLEGEEASG